MIARRMGAFEEALMSNKRPTTHEAQEGGDERQAGDHEPTHDDSRSTPHAPSHARRSTTHEQRSSTHADAHAHALALDPRRDEPQADPIIQSPGPFPHEKLDVYRVALEMVALAKLLAEQIPRGYRNVADHLLRAASNTVLLYAEGANRRGAGLKRQRFVESRGESGEVAAAGDLIVVLQIGDAARATQMKHLAGRVSAMLTRLIARLE